MGDTQPSRTLEDGDGSISPLIPMGGQSTSGRSVGFTDSGYSSLDLANDPNTIAKSTITITQDSSSTKALKSFSAKNILFKPKQPELRLFPDSPVPDEFYRRFLDLIQLYDRPVKSKLKPKFMAWKVKVLGEDEDSKRPFIVILCDANSTKPIRKFFAKKEIKQQCEETANLPSLPVLVVASAPVRVAADMPSVYGREEVYLSESTTCGESIKIVYDGKAKMATLGGVIKVVIGDKVNFFALTAGHVIDGTTDEAETQDDDGDEISDISDDSGIEDDYEDDCDSGLGTLSTDSKLEDIHVPTEDGLCNFGWTKIGYVFKPPGNTKDPEYRNLDWSLVEILDVDRAKMNQVKDMDNTDATQKALCIDKIYKLDSGCVTNRPVLFQPGTEPRCLKGRISTTPSFMQQSPSQKLARVYSMSWESDWDQVTSGDCGSWVIDQETCELYGHIVAIDLFGEAYVVPFEDTIAQIAEFLGADSVGLPSQEDFELKTDPQLDDLGSTVVNTPPIYDASLAAARTESLIEDLINELERVEETYSKHQLYTPTGEPKSQKYTILENLVPPETYELPVSSFEDIPIDLMQSLVRKVTRDVPASTAQHPQIVFKIPPLESDKGTTLAEKETPIFLVKRLTIPRLSLRDYGEELKIYCHYFQLAPPFYNLTSPTSTSITLTVAATVYTVQLHTPNSLSEPKAVTNREALSHMAAYQQRRQISNENKEFEPEEHFYLASVLTKGVCTMGGKSFRISVSSLRNEFMPMKSHRSTHLRRSAMGPPEEKSEPPPDYEEKPSLSNIERIKEIREAAESKKLALTKKLEKIEESKKIAYDSLLRSSDELRATRTQHADAELQKKLLIAEKEDLEYRLATLRTRKNVLKISLLSRREEPSGSDNSYLSSQKQFSMAQMHRFYKSREGEGSPVPSTPDQSIDRWSRGSTSRRRKNSSSLLRRQTNKFSSVRGPSGNVFPTAKHRDGLLPHMNEISEWGKDDKKVFPSTPGQIIDGRSSQTHASAE